MKVGDKVRVVTNSWDDDSDYSVRAGATGVVLRTYRETCAVVLDESEFVNLPSGDTQWGFYFHDLEVIP